MSDSRYIAGKRLLNARNSFDSNAIRDFFNCDDMQDAEDSRLLNEADWRSEKLTDDFFVAAGYLFTSGFQATFSRDLTPDQVTEFADRFMYHLRKYPDFAHIMNDLMDKMAHGHPDFDDDDGDGMAAMDVAGSDRAEMVDRIAGAVLDAISDGGWTGEFNKAELDDLTNNMIAAGDLDGEMWHDSDIDYEEINDRVDEFKDEDDPIGDDLLGSDDEDDEDRGEWGGRGWL
jgi:hypothetical protein